MRSERGHVRHGITLQTSALDNEAYLRLIDAGNVQWQNRAHFFAISANLMRRILVDYARSRNYVKRGGAAQRVALEEAAVFSEEQAPDLVALDDALNGLAKIDEKEEPGGGVAFLRRAERGGNSRGVEGLARHRHARLAAGQIVAPARTWGVGMKPEQMQPEHWRQIEQIYHAALERDADERGNE